MNLSGCKKPKSRRSLHFFEMIANSLVITVVGIFATICFIFLPLSVLFFKPEYNQVILFTLLGIVVFLSSYKFFIRYHGYVLRNLNYENFVEAKKRLISWFFWTLSSYLLCVWFLLLLLGSTNGFNIKFPTQDNRLALISQDMQSLKILGIILLTTHSCALMIFKIVSYYWGNIVAFAYREFDRRRKMLELVRSKANIK